MRLFLCICEKLAIVLNIGHVMNANDDDKIYSWKRCRGF